MHDPVYDSSEEQPYECFTCGTIVRDRSHPGACPECGGGMRNRRYPLE